ncbi:proton channel OTOP1 [Denticeps clupeoides]|uniref:Otopetrin 1 n=1 Tax=Denticeps clupeoides TaxID=299321 RepID=A0AAY4E4I8_9TELE|nr:proton channel OTOP1 [Denticeps clupeoides]
MDFGTMVEHDALDIMGLNRYCNSSSSSSASERDGHLLKKLRGSLSRNYPQKNAEMLSAQYGMNLLLIGAALMLALTHHGPAVKEEHLLGFITALMVLQLLWMFWYVVRKKRQRNFAAEKDAHAGTRWIRGGLTLLAVLSLIMDAFRIGFFVGYHTCLSAVLWAYPVVHAIHTVSQVHFLWFHIKDVIRKYETFERFGVIHAVFTNLLLWCNGVMSEAEHFLNHHKRRLTDMGFMNFTVDDDEDNPHCNCTTSACTVFSSSLNYLYPFNIEYHIFVSAMLFVMWKNIGRTIDHHANHKKPNTRTTGLCLGPLLGLVALASTIGVLVVYLIYLEESVETQETAITMFYIYSIAILSLMCLAGVVGLLIYRAEGLPMDQGKNPSRQLDMELLFSSSVGSWLMSWCSVVAVISSSSSPTYRWTSLVYSLLLILEKYVQNLFIVESLYRQRPREGGLDASQDPGSPGIFTVAADMVPPYNGIINQAYDNQDKFCASMESEPEENGQVYSGARKPSQVPLPVVLDLEDKPSRKRQILKNITVFLFMCNVSLWILPAFGCRPQYDNGLEQNLYGFTTWSTVLNFAIPLNLFYRMHCVASLFEVFRKV